MKTKRAPLVSFRIPSEDYESLQGAAKASGQSISELVRNALGVWLSGPVEAVEVTSGGAEMTVESPNNATRQRTRNVVPSVSVSVSSITGEEIQVTPD